MKELIEKIQSIAKYQERFVISIDGPAASGKSTLANYLQKELGAVLFHMDDYFLPDDMKTKERLSVPGGNVFYERMQQEILEHLSDNQVTYQKYDCMVMSLLPPITEMLPKFIVIEGVYSQQNSLRRYYDFTIYTTVDKKEQLDRLFKRNPRLYDRFIQEWLPLEEDYFSKENIQSRSDYQVYVPKM